MITTSDLQSEIARLKQENAPLTPADVEAIRRETYLIPRGETNAARANSGRLRRIYADPETKAALIKKQRDAGRPVWSRKMKAWWADPVKRAALLELRRKDLSHARRRQLGAILTHRAPRTDVEIQRKCAQKRRNRTAANQARWRNPAFRTRLLAQLAAAREKEYQRRREAQLQ